MAAKQSKVSKATQAAIRGGNFYDDGVALGQDAAVSDDAVVDALKSCKTPADRSALLAGFIAGYCGAAKRKVSAGAAKRKFYRMAKMYAPAKSNRQAKANAKKEADAAIDAASKPTATVMSEKDMAKALIAATLFIAEWQGATQDAPTLDRLGKLLTIITPKAASKKIGKSKSGAVEVLDADDAEADDAEA